MTATFWQTWKEFEIRHGNEDTIREMLRIKRSVQATYNTQVNFMTSQMMKATTSSTGERGCYNSLAVNCLSSTKHCVDVKSYYWCIYTCYWSQILRLDP